jgi:hypothetical protein
MRLLGRVSKKEGSGEGDRVVAVGDNQTVLGETVTDSLGEWSMEVDEQVEWVSAQISGPHFAAAAKPVAECDYIEMPDQVQLNLALEGELEGVLFYLDPVMLNGFPQDLLWALRMHPGRIVDLHIREYTVVEQKRLQLKVQPGRYRLSGGRISIHPMDKKKTILLTSALDETTMKSYNGINGGVVLDVFEEASYRLLFS